MNSNPAPTKKTVTTKDRVFILFAQGCRPTETAAGLGVSKPKAHQILSDPPTRPGRRPAPFDGVEIQFQRWQYFKAEQIPQVMDILKSRDSWTWVEANREPLKHSLKPAANNIIVFCVTWASYGIGMGGVANSS